MRGKVIELMVKINNLKELYTHTIRIGERDISRVVRREIDKREKELIVLKVQMEKYTSELK
jgi:hypothetical protein